jgi:hypothetical protein
MGEIWESKYIFVEWQKKGTEYWETPTFNE